MRTRHWLLIAFAALTMMPTGLVEGETRTGENPAVKAEAVRFHDLRQEFVALREAYGKWAELETRTAPTSASERRRVARQAALDYEYERLQTEMRRLIADRRRAPFKSARGEELTALAERARRLVTSLRAAQERERLEAAAVARIREESRAAPGERVRTRPTARGGTPSRVGHRAGLSAAASETAGWAVSESALDPSSRESRILDQAAAVLAGLRRQPISELCRRGWEKRSGRGSASESTPSGRRDRLDGYSRMLPWLERSLARIRDGATETETGVQVAAAADHLLRALRPFGRALEGCSKGGRGLCGEWQPPESLGTGLPAARIRALPRSAISGPPNDDCVGATAIGNGTFVGDTTDATNDGEASCGTSSTSPDVWYSYTAAADETILFSTLGSSYDTVLSVHDGCPGNIASELACNDDWVGGQSQLSLDVAAGQTYLIRVSGFYGDAGVYELSVGPGGSISGTVTLADSGDPVEWFDVRVVDHRGDEVGWVSTDVSGSYVVSHLPAGDYYAHTWNWGEYVGELYGDPDNLPCPNGSCSYSSGTPIPVALGADTGGIDFALERGGSIVGTVTDAATGLPLDAWVGIYDTTGNWLTDGWPAGDGTYDAIGLPTGSHFALTSNDEGYFNEIYDDLLCPVPWTCDVTVGTPIAVIAPAVTAGIDFALVRGGSISGRLEDEVTGRPVGGFVHVFDSTGEHIQDAWPDGAGDYRTGSGLPTGTYFARSNNWDGYVNELYDDIPCPDWCDERLGTPIAVTAGLDTGGIDIALKKEEGAIAGRVTDGVTGWPIDEVTIQVYDAGGGYVTDGSTNAEGYYISNGSLSPGTYYAVTSNGQGWDDELWQEMGCTGGGCDPTTGIPIDVNGYVLGIDFTLEKEGAIVGEVTDADTGAPLVDVWIDIYDGGGGWVTDAYTDSAGRYVSWDSLAPGTYYAATWNDQGYLDELWDDLECWRGCNPTDGTPIVVSSYATADFALVKGGDINGTVTDADTGDPLEGVWVDIWDDVGGGVTNGWTDAAGHYTVYGALPPGTYYATTNNYQGYLDELYDDLDCWFGCDPTDGTPIVLSTSATVDFALVKGGEINGTVTDADTSLPLEGVQVDIYDDVGDWITNGETGAAGGYIAERGLPAGTYYATTWNDQGYLDELYDDLDCWLGCNPTDGTEIVVSTSATADFALVKGGAIGGTITDRASGAPLEGVEVTIHKLEPGGIDTVEWVTTDAAGDYLSNRGLVAGSYVANTYNWSGYIDELWDVGYCVGFHGPSVCWPGDGTPIPVTLGATTPGVDFALDLGATVSGQVNDAVTGAPIDATVRIHDFDYNFVADAWTDGAGSYETQPALPPGSYFAGTENWSGYVDEIWDDVATAGSNFGGAFGGEPISLTVPPGVTGIDFALEPGAVISGHVTDAATTDPLGRWCYRVWIYDAAGRSVGTWRDDSGNYWTQAGMPPGTYYANAWSIWCGEYATEAWDGLACPYPECDLTETTPIVVASGDPVPGIDFALDRRAAISGQVTDDAMPANPLEVELAFFDASGRQLWEDSSDPSTGQYSTRDDFAAGDVYVRTVNTSGFVDEAWDNVPCAGCDPAIGTPIVISGVSVGAIDFALSTGGAISGQVTDAFDDSPLPGVFVLFVNDATGWAASYAETDGAGMYTSYGALASGNYYVATENEQGYVDELYDGVDGVACPGQLHFTWDRGCSLGDGTSVAVTSPATTADIDFALDAGGGIAGTVSWALTGEPLSTDVWIYDSSGTFLEDVWTDTGDYSSVYGLPAGAYYLHTRNWGPYPDECYQDMPCPGGSCDPTLGTPIAVTTGAMTYGIDLELGSLGCDQLASVVDVTGWIDYPARFMACSEIRVWSCEAGPNADLELMSGETVLLEEITVQQGAELTIWNQP